MSGRASDGGPFGQDEELKFFMLFYIINCLVVEVENYFFSSSLLFCCLCYLFDGGVNIVFVWSA